MTEDVTFKEKMARYKMRILALVTVSSMTLVQYASAGNLSDAITPMLEDIASLFTPLLALILAAIPLIIAMSLISFVLGILAAILLKLNLH